MSKERILIVEDEQIVAEDLKRILEGLGYEVVGKAASGEAAIAQVEKTRPQMVLMDIRLEGKMDGIEVAEYIYTHYDIPVSYLTAYADKTTLERAKATLPFGYILKPFEERHLETTIELALFRHKMDGMFKSLDQSQAAALQNLSEAVLSVNEKDQVTFMNRAAEELLDLPLSAAFGKPVKNLLQFSKDDSSSALIQRKGEPALISFMRNPIRNELDQTIGSVFVLKETATSHASKPSLS